MIASENKPAAPPPFTDAMRHGMSPDPRHDEIARFNFIGALANHVATRVFPGNRLAYEQRVRPALEARHGRPPANRQEVRRAMADDVYYQFWSGLRRLGQEMRQENGRTIVLRQLPSLIDRARALNEGSNRLQLDPDVKIPRYLSAVDVHCMPGGYHTELAEDDVASAANYDIGLFMMTAGLIGKWTDGAGRALLAWLRRAHSEFKPRRILDMGTGVGHNIVPFAQAFPDAEIVAVDVAAPMLRYAHARAEATGRKVQFSQMNAEKLDFPDNSFDFVTSSFFLHEIPVKSTRAVFKEIHRVLKPGGLMLHFELPPAVAVDPYYDFYLDWDTYNNNEPSYAQFRAQKPDKLCAEAGFSPDKYMQKQIYNWGTYPDETFIACAKGETEAPVIANGGTWFTFGAWK